MKYLIDTHTFLWYGGNDKKLSQKSKELIENPQNQIFISIASLWEIAIKNSIGKLDISIPYKEIITEIDKSDFVILPITFADTIVVNQLPWKHKDPFDRIIIAQSIANQIPIISCDIIFDEYDKIQRIW
jgi:PIN domain nuclease of toxin-antitoxin system